MARFRLSETPFDTATLRAELLDARVGGYASFEGWVRDHNDGRSVDGLRYEAYATLAETEGEAILAEALAKFDILDVHCVHRTGDLAIGELAVWVGVSAAHRDAAFAAEELREHQRSGEHHARSGDAQGGRGRLLQDLRRRQEPLGRLQQYAGRSVRDAGWLHPRRDQDPSAE